MLMKPFLSLLTLVFFLPSLNAQEIKTSGSTTFCAGGSVTLQAPDANSYQWLKDGTIVNGQRNKSYTVSLSGSYAVILITGEKKDTTKEVIVKVNPNPTANFSFADNQCSSSPIQFTNQSTGTGLKYTWDFGDAQSSSNTSNQENPVHRFVGNNRGDQSFSVKLIITTADGCTDQVTKTVRIKKPYALLDGTGAVEFNNQNYFSQCYTVASDFDFTYSGSGNNLYKIIWGDGKPDYSGSALSTTSHNYDVGIYNLKFIVGGGACSDTANYKVFVGSNPGGSISNPSSTQGCTGQTFLLPFANAKDNPLGTIYTVSVNDGSPTDVFYQPVPENYAHTFNKTSCGTGNNFFTVSYTISNPCGIVPGTISGIGISQKPTANFSLSKDTTCVGKDVVLDNTSSEVKIVSSLGQCSNGKSVWKISPATGWTVVRGNLGDDKGGNIITNWTSSQDPVTIRFNTPGQYSIKLKLAGNQTCGMDSLTKQICVNPEPTASFTMDKPSGCSPLTTAMTTTTNTLNCGTYSYLWSVAYQPAGGCDPNDGKVIYGNGTNEHSKQPVMLFNSPGTYTISLTVTAPDGSCTYTTASQTITVSGKPVLGAINVPDILCQGTIVSPAVSATCNMTGATWSWNFGTGTPATSTQQIPGQIAFPSLGTTAINVSVSNSCGTSSQVSKSFLVNPGPKVEAPKDSVYCAGSKSGDFHLTSSQPGITVTWTNNNTAVGLGSSGSGDIPSFTTVNNGAAPLVAVITVSASLNGCTASATFSITVNPQPGQPAVTTPVHYCQGETAVSLEAVAGTGSTLTWFAQPSGGAGTATAPIPITTSIGSTDYYVSQQNNYGCISARTLIKVTVDAVPVPTLAGSVNPATCASASGSITLAGLNPSTVYNISYHKNGNPVTASLSSSGTGSIILSSLTAGTYDQIIVTINGCSSKPLGPVALVDPTPPASPVPTAVNALCSGNTLQLKANPVATGTATFHWTGPDGFSSDLENPSFTTGVNSGGSYLVTTTIDNCTSAAGKVDVIVNPTPALPVLSGASPICEHESLNITALPYADPVTYAWTGPGGFKATTETIDRPNAVPTMSGDYTLVVTSGKDCPSPQATINILVNTQPLIGTASKQNPANCGSATGSISLSGLLAGTGYTVSYNSVAGPQTGTLTTDANGTLLIGGLTSGIYKDVAVILKGCKSPLVGPFTLVDPDPPASPTVQSNSPVCAGTTLTLTAASGVADAIFNWTGPAGFTANDNTTSISNVGLDASGTYYVTVTTHACTSQPAALPVIVIEVPEVPSAVANTPVCDGGMLSLMAATKTEGTITYSWTGPAGFKSNEQSPKIDPAWAANAGTYSVTASNRGCISRGVGSVDVVVKPTAEISKVSKADPTSCGSFTGVITLEHFENATPYLVEYTFNGGGAKTIPLNSNPVGAIILPDLPAGIYSNIRVLLDGCPSQPAGPVTLTDLPPLAPFAGSSGPICEGSSLQLKASVATTDNVTFLWVGPGGYSSNEQNPVIPVTTAANNGQYAVRATVNGCSASSTVDVVVSALSKGGITGNDTTVCTGTNAGVITLSGQVGAVNHWEYATDAAGSWALLNNTTGTQPYRNLTGTTFYRAVVQNGVCPQVNSAPSKISVINSVGLVDAGADRLICNQSSITLNGSTPIVGAGVWTQLSGPSVTITPPTDPNSAVTGLSAGQTYTFRWQVNGPPGCGSAADAVTIINRPDVTKATVNPDQGICDFPAVNKVSLTGNSTQTAFETGAWSIISQPPGSSGQIADPGSPVTSFTASTPGQYMLQWSIKDDAAGCVPSVASTLVDIRPKPDAAFSTSTIRLCEGQAVTVTNKSQHADTYTWLWGDGTTAGFLQGSHTYSNAGDFTITLVAEENVLNAHCTDTARSALVHVGASPGAEISVSPGIIITQPKRTFDFTDASASVPEKSWLWKMGDRSGQTRSGESISYTYADPGRYLVQLLTTDNTTGCTSTDTMTVTIEFVPGYLQVPNAICPGCTSAGLRNFLPLGKGLSYYHLRIYNSWGKQVFESTGLNADGSPAQPWNAQFNNTGVTQNVYRWEIEARFINGSEWKGMQYPNHGKPVKSGFITVIK